MISTDIFLEIGSQHKVCEDYIIQGSDPTPYIILSDGCSSSNNTEMGARILCHLAKQYLRYRCDELASIEHEKMGRWIIHNAEMAARQMGLTMSCLDATLLVAFELDDQIKIFVYGDGCFFVHDPELGRMMTKVDYSNNAPYYLSYLIDDYRNEQYHEMKNHKTITRYAEKEVTGSDLVAYDHPTYFFCPKNRFSSMFISSDGLLSFIVENPAKRRNIDPLEIIPDMMAFKNTKGEFLKRRMKKAMKDLSNKGINHYDDLSVGAFISI